ncbi:Alpha/Beta hydrolase protein [Diplogelasinospora grovesii]|uniref:Alpha/Beta hydrolase protein n=1 Tax=Diplogelasinospora grovesii TaxID=303347 RepID=A0AAN6NHJ7_9PEZI|nr:Alpha/Beta hydrolase protein [Diplogelasinospora grovesii]
MATITEHDVSYGDDKKIHYLASGPAENGPLIICLHGWPATAITWKSQLDAFATLGFRCVAPDMPGYGQSTARHEVSDYSQQSLVTGMMALLSHTGRKSAVWVGHDWGAGVASSVATQHPEVVKALVTLCVPYRTIELGWKGFLPLVNREIYPAEEYEYGQWDYMKNYEENFEKAVAWFDSDIAGLLKAVMQPSKPAGSRISPFANIRKDGGFFGGAPKPPSADMIPQAPIIPADVFSRMVKEMEGTGFWGGSAYYMNHESNGVYNGRKEGKLSMPVMFIHATRDLVCDTKTSRLAEPMREHCSNLTEVTIDVGHWVQLEKPQEVNAALTRFILEELPGEWPGFWESGYTKRKTIL